VPEKRAPAFLLFNEANLIALRVEETGRGFRLFFQIHQVGLAIPSPEYWTKLADNKKNRATIARLQAIVVHREQVLKQMEERHG
jgi:hypothetical protein